MTITPDNKPHDDPATGELPEDQTTSEAPADGDAEAEGEAEAMEEAQKEGAEQRKEGGYI